MSTVKSPEVLVSCERTAQTNSFIKKSAAALRAVAEDNVRLQADLLKVKQSEATLSRKEQVIDLIAEGLAAGVLSPGQVRSKLSQWSSETVPVETYRQQLLPSREAFAGIPGSGTTKESSVRAPSWGEALTNLANS